MLRPADVLTALVTTDPGRPRITAYDDTPGPTHGERVELSARVFSTWVAKAANALQEDLDIGPGSVVRLALPAHWRAVVWAFATWAVGACVALDDGPADVVVSDDPAVLRARDAEGVLVTLPALARVATEPLPPGAMDEARDLASHPDRFEAWARPGDADVALRALGATTTYGSWSRDAEAAHRPPGSRVLTTTPDLGRLLDLAMEVWSVDGSLVHCRGEVDEEILSARAGAERVTERA